MTNELTSYDRLQLVGQKYKFTRVDVNYMQNVYSCYSPFASVELYQRELTIQESVDLYQDAMTRFQEPQC